MFMGFDVNKVLKAMREGSEIHFPDLAKVCEHFFGAARNNATSHNIFKTPWPGYPLNIQNDKGKSKAYQVRQVLAAVDRLVAERQRAIETQKPPEKESKPKKK